MTMPFPLLAGAGQTVGALFARPGHPSTDLPPPRRPLAMGRVLVFTLPTCTHCRAAKATLARRGVPYVEVSLSAHRRAGATWSPCPTARRSRRSSSTTTTSAARPTCKPSSTPTRTPSTRARARALAAPTPSTRDSRPPDDADADRGADRAERATETTKPRAPHVASPPGDPHPRRRALDHVAAVALLREILPLEDRPWNLTVFRRCVPGSVAVDAMVSRFGPARSPSREDAVDALRRLQRAGVMCHVRDEHPFEDVPDLFYRLAPDQRPSTVNGFRAVPADEEGSATASDDPSDDAPTRVADSLRRVARIHARHVDEMTGLVDYAAVASDPEWLVFLDGLALLGRTRLSDVTPLRRRVAMLINLYNLGVATSRATVGAPRSSSERSKYFDDVRWVLGGRVYTLNDVEHG